MLVVFQNTIIYNPFLPPDARRLEIADYAGQCRGVTWNHEMIKSLDGTPIALCVSDEAPETSVRTPATVVYVLYFQGNASSLPPRLPEISSILRRVRDADKSASYSIIGVSYRGYWKSHDRPSEKGINLDIEAALRWVGQLHRNRHPGAQRDPVVLLWGQSVGCGFASNLAANTTDESNLTIHGMILETPFTNTRAMLQALYPQKWLPYQYLWPFLRNQLDTWKNLKTVAEKSKGRPMPVYIVEAGSDELVPQNHGQLLVGRCKEVGLPVQWYTVRRALHNDVSIRLAGKQAIAEYLQSAVAAAQTE
ncbi:alpha/beta superfamily hydrolase [Cordyceps javanica]|uniref:Alpha/beta superfamily hydrolase n=1 Tax=Cordyceps javanica TaxID=43265 RepID=A0A545V5C1_9HYPO|nr:alpha/beta superfamily hydrolase [Cordyceps javanica]TQW08173.1 alpha/beta superfamily hydrolase [Cordyceps javanica]